MKKTRLDSRQMEYIEKWKNSDKDLKKELTKWGDMLWLGRSLSLVKYYDKETQKRVIKEHNEIIEKYMKDPDFKKYMFDGDDIKEDKQYGDSHWAEISCNVGALRYLLSGEWNTDS